MRLVVGVVRLVEDIVTLARARHPENAPMSEVLAKDERAKKAVFFGLNEAIATAGAAAKQKEIVKENLSEYFLYTVEGRDTIPNGWSKRLPRSRLRMFRSPASTNTNASNGMTA